MPGVLVCCHGEANSISSFLLKFIRTNCILKPKRLVSGVWQITRSRTLIWNWESEGPRVESR